jgi:hypothetical protein
MPTPLPPLTYRQQYVQDTASREAADELAAKNAAHEKAKTASDQLVNNVSMAMGRSPIASYQDDLKGFSQNPIVEAEREKGQKAADAAGNAAASAFSAQHRAAVNAHIDAAYQRAAANAQIPQPTSTPLRGSPQTSPPSTTPSVGIPVPVAQDLQTNP